MPAFEALRGAPGRLGQFRQIFQGRLARVKERNALRIHLRQGIIQGVERQNERGGGHFRGGLERRLIIERPGGSRFRPGA